MTQTPLKLHRSKLELRTDPAHDTFDVRHFAVQDGINTLFSVDLVVVCENPAVDFEATIGAKASFRISGAGEGPGAIGGESGLFLLNGLAIFAAPALVHLPSLRLDR